MKYTYFLSLAGVFALLFGSLNLGHASEPVAYNKVFGPGLATTASAPEVSDPNWPFNNPPFVNDWSRAVVIFSMDLDQYQGSSYDAEIVLAIEGWDETVGPQDPATLSRPVQL